jgi:hypothetical protein
MEELSAGRVSEQDYRATAATEAEECANVRIDEYSPANGHERGDGSGSKSCGTMAINDT